MARITPGALADPLASLDAGPDTVWDGESGDIAIAPLGDPDNAGGLLARNPLLTALVLSLECDARAEPDPVDPDSHDLRGWPGDGFDLRADLGEAPLGSRTWEAYRFPVDPENASRVRDAALIALRPLQRQGVIGRVDVQAVADEAGRRIERIIHIERPGGGVIYSGPFAGLWAALAQA
jgi:phage gp46-like protein